MTRRWMSLALSVLATSCEGEATCPDLDPRALDNVGCGLGFHAGEQAGLADRKTCEFGRTPVPDIDDEPADEQAISDFCLTLVGSGQAVGGCLNDLRLTYRRCAPGGYAYGYFGDDGFCPSESDTGDK